VHRTESEGKFKSNMETKSIKNRNCKWFGWHLLGVIFVAFGASLLILFPDFFMTQVLKVSVRHKGKADNENNFATKNRMIEF
jgi:hypothetical protein